MWMPTNEKGDTSLMILLGLCFGRLALIKTY